MIALAPAPGTVRARAARIHPGGKAKEHTVSKGSTGPRKVSKAAMQRRLTEVQAHRMRPLELPGTLQELVDGYQCRFLTEQQMQLVRPFLAEVIAASGVTAADTMRDYRTHVAALAGYALARGRQLTRTEVLTTAFIDEYVRVGMAGEADNLKGRRRSILLGLASQANPGPTAPAKMPPLPHTSVRPPYTPAELAVIVRICGGQPTERKGRDLSAVVGMGAGAGLDSVDQRGIRVEHVVDLGEDGLDIHVQPPRPRIVPVRASLEHLLRRATAGRRGEELLVGLKPDRRNTSARAVENAALYKVPHIEPARLRATWLADLMTDAVPLGVLLQAAGLKSARTLADLLPQLGPWLEHKDLPTATLDVLRGGAR